METRGEILSVLLYKLAFSFASECSKGTALVNVGYSLSYSAHLNLSSIYADRKLNNSTIKKKKQSLGAISGPCHTKTLPGAPNC